MKKFIFILLTTQLTLYSQQWRVFTISNSPLPSNITAGIVVDDNNIKWIGTTNGMVRIEGNNWQIFDTMNTPCGTNGIYPMALDSFNNIWSVLTSNGKLISQLVNKVQGKGKYNIVYDAKNLSSGIYYYQLVVNDFKETRKMVLIK